MANTLARRFPSPDGYDPGIPTKRGYLMPRESIPQSGSGRVGPHTIGAAVADVPTQSVTPLGANTPSERLWDQLR